MLKKKEKSASLREKECLKKAVVDPPLSHPESCTRSKDPATEHKIRIKNLFNGSRAS